MWRSKSNLSGGFQPRSRSRWVRAIGEGLLAGMGVGSLLAFWEVWLGRDLHHGLAWLAAERMLEPMLAGALAGMVLSIGVEAYLRLCHRGGRRATFLGLAGLGLTYLVLTGLSALVWRLELFPLYPVTSKPVSIMFFAGLAGLVFLLLVARGLDALSRMGRPSSRAEPFPPAKPLEPPWQKKEERDFAGAWREPLSRVAVPVAILVLLGWVAVPVLAEIRARDRRPILMVSIDTLRADRLGIYGATRPTSPGLDRLAREGLIFDQAWSAAPWTLPSHASIFTSLLPFEHRARRDGRVIVPKLVTLAERLRNAGYRTAAFTGGGYVSSVFGFEQGFEIYRDLDEEKGGGPRMILEPARRWLEDHRDEPFFLFVHTYEPHSPFEHTRFTNPDERGRLGETFSVEEVDDIHRGRLVLTSKERKYVNDLYDGDVAQAAGEVGRFLERLQREGILDQLVLILFSDHGEELWEHHPEFSPAHGHSLYEEVLRVPLVVRAPGLVPAAVRIRNPVSLLDVAPTLLDLAGLEPEPTFRGRSLVPTLLSGDEPDLVPIWAESTQFGPDRFAMRQGSVKVVLTPQPTGANNDVSFLVKPIEVFNLSEDPAETRNLSGEMDAVASHLLEMLWPRAERVFNRLHKDQNVGELPDELREQLRSLGYTQ